MNASTTTRNDARSFREQLERWRRFLLSADLTNGAVRIGVCMLEHVNERAALESGKFRCWPSITRLAAMTRSKEEGVRKALRNLREAGIIVAIGGGKGPGKSTIYEFNGEKLAAEWSSVEAEFWTWNNRSAEDSFGPENRSCGNGIDRENRSCGNGIDRENRSCQDAFGQGKPFLPAHENRASRHGDSSEIDSSEEDSLEGRESKELTLFARSGDFSDEEAGEEGEVDFASLVWSEGRAFLASRGVKPSQIGGLIGLWRKTLQDDEKLLELIGRAVAENIDHPVPWMQVAIRRELASPRKAPAQELRGGLAPEERARRFGKFEVISSTDPIEVREAWRRRAYPIPEWVEEEERRRAEAARDDR